MGVTVVTGPPCGGKTFHVEQHRTPAAVVVDLDAIAHALGYPAEHLTWPPTERDHPARGLARSARNEVLSLVLAQHHRDEVWVIDSEPTPAMRRRYRAAGARFVEANPGLEPCLRRAATRDDVEGTRRQVVEWFARHPQRVPVQ